MPLDNGSITSTEIQISEPGPSSQKESLVVEKQEGVEVLEGVDFTKYVDVVYLTSEEVKRRAAESRKKVEPVDYRYIEQMKKEGITEELAIKAFVGSFRGNENQTQFFLSSTFYYGSDTPTPLDQLRKAIVEDTIPECIDLLEKTKDSLERGNHF